MGVCKIAATGAATIALLLATAAGASAATTRYVSPSGVGDCTSAASPCSLATGLTTAVAGDEVRLAPGDYTLATALLSTLAGSIAGTPDQPRPRITLPPAFPLPTPSEGMRHVELIASSTVALGNATLEDAIVRSDVTGAALSVAGGLVRNAVVLATGTGATGVNATGMPSKLRNVTVIATGAGSAAVRATGIGVPPPPPAPPVLCVIATPASADLLNVIARGEANDLLAVADPFCPGATGTITAKTSNFRPDASPSFVDGGGNQSTDPLFADAAAGNFAQLPGSPTIDAGTAADDIGTLDLAGVSRVLDGVPDIGGFEFVKQVTAPGGGTPGGGTPGGGGSPGGGVAGDDRPPVVRLLKPKGLRLRALVTRGWRLRASCSEACTLALTLVPATGKRVVLARGAAARKAAGTASVRLKPTKAGRRAVRSKRSMRLRFVVVGKDAAGQRGTAQRALKIRR